MKQRETKEAQYSRRMREGEEAILAAALHWAEVDSECRKYSEYTNGGTININLKENDRLWNASLEACARLRKALSESEYGIQKNTEEK